MTSNTNRSLWNMVVSVMMVRSVLGAIPTEVPFTRTSLLAMVVFNSSGSEKSWRVTWQEVRSFNWATMDSARSKKLSRTLKT